MQANSCSKCLDWTSSAEAVLDVLKGRWQQPRPCPHQENMAVVMDQFRCGRSHWWVVDDRVVVPMWIVERLQGRGSDCGRALSEFRMARGAALPVLCE